MWYNGIIYYYKDSWNVQSVNKRSSDDLLQLFCDKGLGACVFLSQSLSAKVESFGIFGQIFWFFKQAPTHLSRPFKYSQLFDHALCALGYTTV